MDTIVLVYNEVCDISTLKRPGGVFYKNNLNNFPTPNCYQFVSPSHLWLKND